MSMTRRLAMIPFVILLAIIVLSLFFPSLPKPVKPNLELNGADIAWMLCATGLVLIMTPGLAFFYGGMVSKKKCIVNYAAKFYMHVYHHSFVGFGGFQFGIWKINWRDYWQSIYIFYDERTY